MGSYRSEREATSQTVTSPLPATAASVRPSGEKASACDLAAGLHQRCADGGQIARIPQGDALLGEADRDQPAVGAEPARVTVVVGRHGSRRRERERSPDAAGAGQVPGDGVPVTR